MTLPPHGTIDRYRKTRTRAGCRCERCQAANRSWQRHYREGLRGDALRDAVSLDEPLWEPLGHGTRACYARGCREDECVQANRDYAAAHARMARRGLRRRDLREQGLDLDEYLF